MAQNLKPKTLGTPHLRLINTVTLFVLFAIVPLFTQSPYYLNLLIMSGIYAVLAMTFVLLLRTGLITLAIAAFWGIGAYSSTMLVLKLHMSFWLSLPLSVIITGVFGLGLGFILVRNPGFGFVAMTMMIGLLFSVAVGSTAFLGGYPGIFNIPKPEAIHLPPLPPIRFASDVAFYYLMMLLVLAVVLVFSAFYRAWTGRAWTAIGLNKRLAESLGINVFRYRMVAFVVAAAASGLMGSFYAHYQAAVNPETFSLFRTLYVHIYAILGGLGFPILGPVIGSMVMVFFAEVMRFAQAIQPIIIGALLIVLIVFLPKGLLSLRGLQEFATDPVKSVIKIGRAVTRLGMKKT
jgi:branched-chain amino acid transport system permease protein